MIKIINMSERLPNQLRQPEQPAATPAPIVPGSKILPDLEGPLVPRVRRQKLAKDLTPEERAEIIENSMLAKEVTKERIEEQVRLYGKTDEDLEADADAWLKTAGFADLVEDKDKKDK